MARLTPEEEKKKRELFDGLSLKAQQRILKRGYDNWDPFQEPKDPRERIFSSASLNAGALVKEFLQVHSAEQESQVVFKDLFELCRGLLQGEARAQLILEFCKWYQTRIARSS